MLAQRISNDPSSGIYNTTLQKRIALLTLKFPLVEEEISKQKFKELYFIYATVQSGWTKEYWDLFYEKKEGLRFFFIPPTSPAHTRMFIVTEDTTHRMVFLTEEGEESFFE